MLMMWERLQTLRTRSHLSVKRAYSLRTLLLRCVGQCTDLTVFAAINGTAKICLIRLHTTTRRRQGQTEGWYTRGEVTLDSEAFPSLVLGDQGNKDRSTDGGI